MKIVDVDQVCVWILTDNYYDALRPDTEVARRYHATPGKSIHAEHGIAYFVETSLKGKINRCMFDFGLDSKDVVNNARLLNIDLAKADAYFLSHGHFDHWTGVTEILKRGIWPAPGGPPFYVGEEAFLHRYGRRKESDELTDIGQLDKDAIQASGANIVEVRTPTQIIPGCYCTGNIERTTEYETVPPSLLVEREGKIEIDDFRGEQALFLNLKGKGLVVLSGCAHAGMVNTLRHAQKVSGIQKLHAILGGFHLINAKPEIIAKTVADIKAMEPDYVVPAHCTGFEAITAFSQAMPGEFILNTAGTQYSFVGA